MNYADSISLWAGRVIFALGGMYLFSVIAVFIIDRWLKKTEALPSFFKYCWTTKFKNSADPTELHLAFDEFDYDADTDLFVGRDADNRICRLSPGILKKMLSIRSEYKSEFKDVTVDKTNSIYELSKLGNPSRSKHNREFHALF